MSGIIANVLFVLLRIVEICHIKLKFPEFFHYTINNVLNFSNSGRFETGHFSRTSRIGEFLHFTVESVVFLTKFLQNSDLVFVENIVYRFDELRGHVILLLHNLNFGI
jgi:hypothetical protein